MSWIEQLSDVELSEAIESTGAMAARLYAQDADTTEIDARLDELIGEHDRRTSNRAAERHAYRKELWGLER